MGIILNQNRAYNTNIFVGSNEYTPLYLALFHWTLRFPFSFDSDKFEFKEFVDQGVQCTELAAVLVEKEKEGLIDTVTAYEMQNKFLNKEVLELNQLRQQAAEREQKLFM